MKDCKWITSPKATGSDNQLYYFKKEFDLKVVKEARVDISAQARYKLYINGELVGIGPCKGTREKTYFDTIDVTDCLVVGKNEIYVEVLQLAATDMEGKMSPIEGVLRMSYPLLALELVCGDIVIASDDSWLCAKATGNTQLNARSCYSGATREKVNATEMASLVYENAKVQCGISDGEADH